MSVETPSSEDTDSAEWRRILVEGHRQLGIVRTVFRVLPSPPRCKLCLNPFAGVGGRLAGIAGWKRSRKNPNMCTKCCEALPPGGAHVDVAILFADVRASTSLGETLGDAAYASLINRFYHAATRVLVAHDAVVDKLIGDEVMALFLPGMAGKNYRSKSIDAAIALLGAAGYRPGATPWLDLGIGVHAGTAYVGNVGGDVVDFTALGDAVNTASRLQEHAEPGQVVASDALWSSCARTEPTESRVLDIRGKAESVAARIYQPTDAPRLAASSV